MACENCGRELPAGMSTTYPIHYGKKVSRSSTSVRDSSNLNMIHTTTVTTYDVLGHSSVELCTACVRHHQIKGRLTGLGVFAAGILIMGTFGNSIPWLGALGLPVVIVGLVMFGSSFGREFGARWARVRADHRLRKSTGANTFWTERQFGQLRQRV